MQNEMDLTEVPVHNTKALRCLFVDGKEFCYPGLQLIIIDYIYYGIDVKEEEYYFQIPGILFPFDPGYWKLFDLLRGVEDEKATVRKMVQKIDRVPKEQVCPECGKRDT